MENNQQIPHKRRIHYSGKYPRNYNEKYKELNPEKYVDIAEHVIAKGNTPAGTHIPIMVREILDILDINPGEQGFDGTLGYGGHTQAMLGCLKGQGHLYSGDVDSIELTKTTERLRKAGFDETIWSPRLMNFCDIDKLAAEVGKFDFVLADLGVSSMQIDNPERGFSYKTDGPLDLRLDSKSGISAAERLKELSRDELEGMLVENSDEPYAKAIARQIYNSINKGKTIATTTALYQEIVAAMNRVKPADDRDWQQEIKKSCARVFQALRIDVNREYEVLYEFMEKLPNVLNKGARVAILTFHSGEDRIVKKSFQALQRAGDYTEISTEIIRPGKEECYNNSRAHSTKLRWAVK
ncbi:MAG: 16S rRNA (cytosine(1402)-N(4))-methyltransferase RsmH [Anaerovibrio sp.]|uniref:16S rRNA (cytosine(1402)-N(4))-methyltransferase RsmH n=1 Tax=Anaerovibrio sp. TaxID=1872532 RepID=UPI0025F8E82B|nr:16S rRNA (cytosine(1402)-N(4))-methyltransferase RsmH [Anaerovibrio sp.]MCR5175832.1 16S rRNA (cytosine(1402)-N(4))-methyltransferase RsmH [Anaerovibrio sp.]